jgi:hypothetical protein
MRTVHATDTDLLNLMEPGWRISLRAGALGGEIEVEPGILGSVARALGGQARVLEPEALARRWPACTVIALAQVAAEGWRHGEFWPAWYRAGGMRPRTMSERRWAEAFAVASAELDLAPTCTDASDLVLVHAAIPTRCLEEAMRRLSVGEPVEAGGDPAIAALVNHGGAAAHDLLGRCRALVGSFRQSAAEPPSDESARLGLPRRYVDAARRAARTLLDIGPALRLDPYGLGVLRAGSADEGSAGEPVSPREAIGSSDPLLLFTQHGSVLWGVLPPDAVWALHPARTPLRADKPPRVLVESRMPISWRGWRLALLDLDGIAWLELDDPHTRRRLVRGGARPRLVTGPPVPGVTTARGWPVHASLPSLRLPAGDTRWRVEVRRASGGPVLAVVETTAAGWDPGRLWAQTPRPVLGELVFAVTRSAHPDRHDALGAGLRREIAVAEGLDVRYSPGLRLMDGRGLDAAEAVVLTVPGMTASPAAVALNPESESGEVRCVAGASIHALALTPPHIRVRVEPEPGSGGMPTPWHWRGPLALSFADLERGGSLHLDLPGADRFPALEVMAGATAVQSMEPSRRGGYPLRRLLDTVTAWEVVELRARVGGRTATVAVVAGTRHEADPWLPLRSDAGHSPTVAPLG